MPDTKTYFNSYINRDDYEVIKTEAYRLQITTNIQLNPRNINYVDRGLYISYCSNTNANYYYLA